MHSFDPAPGKRAVGAVTAPAGRARIERVGPTLEAELRRTVMTIARQLNRCRGDPVEDHEYSEVAEALRIVALHVERVHLILRRLRLHRDVAGISGGCHLREDAIHGT